MIPVLANPAVFKTLATGGRPGTVADSAGGITRTPTVITVTRWIFDNGHNLTNMLA